MRTSDPDESQLMFLVFDLIHQDGVDLRAFTPVRAQAGPASAVPQIARCRSCVRCKPSRSVLCYSITAASLISRTWFRSAWRRDIRAGPSRNWIKTKCPGWKRINSERYRLFEGPRKPELTEAQKTLVKKRQELARVIERLRSLPLSHGIARD